MPNLGRSVHTLSAFSGVLLVALGLVWPRLSLAAMASRIAFWSLILSDFATIAGFLIAGLWGRRQLDHAVDGRRGARERFSGGSDPDRDVSAAPTGIVSFALILWGLRDMPDPSRAS